MPKPGESTIKLRYLCGAASNPDLQEEFSSLISELGDPSSGPAQEAAGLGFATSEFAGAKVKVDQEGSGFGDVIVVFAILAPSANHALKSIWDQILLPRIKSRLGADAVGEEVEEGSDDEVAELDGSDCAGDGEN